MRLSSPTLLLLSLFLNSFQFFTYAASVDLTSANRRPAIEGLPDWSEVGFMRGEQDLPSDSQVTRTITASMLISQYGVIPNDGLDDTEALQSVIEDCKANSQQPHYTLIQLPAGIINLSHTLYLEASFVIFRGAGNDPNNGGTQFVFRPDENTVYDVLTSGGDQVRLLIPCLHLLLIAVL